jgi:hypothetical protein
MNTSHSESILKAFEKLRADYQLDYAKFATKQDIAARQKDKEIVEQASTYTSDSIFQDLAQLQSIFGQSVSELSTNMITEVEKLAQIRRAILVENQHLKTLQNAQIVAEALNILQQEHKKELQSLEENFQKKHDALEAEMNKQHEIWQKQQQTHEKAKKKQDSLLEKNRDLNEDEFDYKLKWQHTQDNDEYEKRHRALERQLAEENRRKEKDWKERESFLDKHQTQFDEYKTKVESIPKEVEEAVKKSREAAIKETYKDEENKAKLLEREREAKRKAFDLKIETFNKKVDEQKVQITQLTEQLQVASQQIQQLAMTAVSSAGQPVEKK